VNGMLAEPLLHAAAVICVLAAFIHLELGVKHWCAKTLQRINRAGKKDGKPSSP